MCTREFAAQVLRDVNPTINDLTELEVVWAWLQITLAEIFFGEQKTNNYGRILNADAGWSALEKHLKSSLIDARERMIMNPNLCTEILELGDPTITSELFSTITSNEKTLHAIAIDEAHGCLEDQALTYELIMTISRGGHSPPII